MGVADDVQKGSRPDTSNLSKVGCRPTRKHPPHRTRWTRDEKPQPDHRFQLDVKVLEQILGTPKRLYQFTAIDHCTAHSHARASPAGATLTRRTGQTRSALLSVIRDLQSGRFSPRWARPGREGVRTGGASTRAFLRWLLQNPMRLQVNDPARYGAHNWRMGAGCSCGPGPPRHRRLSRAGRVDGWAYALALAAHSPRVIGAVACCALSDMRWTAGKAMNVCCHAFWNARDRDDACALGVETFGPRGENLVPPRGPIGADASDAAVITTPGFLSAWIPCVGEMFTSGVEGYVDDRLANGWATFDVERITCPVTVLHGADDGMIRSRTRTTRPPLCLGPRSAPSMAWVT